MVGWMLSLPGQDGAAADRPRHCLWVGGLGGLGTHRTFCSPLVQTAKALRVAVWTTHPSTTRTSLWMGATARKFRALVVTEEIPDDATDREERVRMRHLVATTGRCPCGAILALPELTPGTVAIVAVEHEPNCPAVDEVA